MHLRHVLLGQLERDPQFRRVGDDEQRRLRVGPHFLSGIDRAVDDDAGDRRAQRVARVAAGRVEILQHALRAIEFGLRLAEIGLCAFEILAREHAELGQLLRARQRLLLHREIRLRLARVGARLGEIGRAEPGEHIFRFDCGTGLRNEFGDAAGDRREHAHGDVFVECELAGQRLHGWRGELLDRRDVEIAQLLGARGEMQRVVRRLRLRRIDGGIGLAVEQPDRAEQNRQRKRGAGDDFERDSREWILHGVVP